LFLFRVVKFSDVLSIAVDIHDVVPAWSGRISVGCQNEDEVKTTHISEMGRLGFC